MRTLLTLDYELFFGARTGTVARSILEPSDAVAAVAERHGARLAWFVDAGYLLRLRAEMARAPRLRADHDAICRQLESLARRGHEIQLHIHPHWEDSRWNGDGWTLDLARYRLQSFAPEAIAEVVRRYTRALRELAGPQAAFAYRAGGWVVQPFAPLATALRQAGVRIDSSVYRGGWSRSAVQPYDFRGAPAKSRWRFRDDPLVEAATGDFLEVPIASCELPPSFFWRLAFARRLGGRRHRAFGDGHAVALEASDLRRKLTRRSVSVVSLDGYKASLLARLARGHREAGCEDFVVIGHPKALTPHSLERLDLYLADRGGDRITGYGEYLEELRGEEALAA